MPLTNNPNNIDKKDIRGRIRDLIVEDTEINLGTHQRNDSFRLSDANINISGLSLNLVLDFEPQRQLSFRFYKSGNSNKLIGPWLQHQIKEYENFKELNIKYSRRELETEGNIAYFVLDIDWQNWETIEDAKKESVQNLAGRLLEFCEDELSGENLEDEIVQFNTNPRNSKALSDYDLYENTNDRQNDVAVPRATNQGSTKETTIDNLPRNLIYFGAPGTGKSYNLNKALENIRENFERVTFYPTYSYAQFVGTYKPVMVQGNTGNNNGNTDNNNGNTRNKEIAYQFVPGPFLRVLTKAINNPDTNYCLVIEEINRANAAAVFGDVFQLLDRNPEGKSEYSIAASEDIKKYLETQNIEIETLSIPQNMYIWATMNSADQGVFPMDTAFKRRWSFEYIEINNGDTGVCNEWVIEGSDINWNVFRKFVNGLLSSFDVNEDKLMGPYFVKADEENTISEKSFASKVLMYLWEDAARMFRKNIFGAEIKTYSQLVSEWDTNKIKIFEKCKSKWENNGELSRLYGDIMNHLGDAQPQPQPPIQAEDVITEG